MRGLTDRNGVALPDALAAHGVDLDRAGEAAPAAAGAAAYLELHIEQGPVLERLDLPLGVVLGSFGVERHRLTFTGRHAHSGATPMDAPARRFPRRRAQLRRLPRRRRAARADVRATTGSRARRARHPDRLQRPLRDDARPARTRPRRAGGACSRPPAAPADRIAGEEGCEVAWEPVFAIDPIPFDRELVALAEDVVRGARRRLPPLPSGPLHDASEMARALPAAMLFVRSIGGVSHTSAEDSRVEDIELGVRALYELTRRVCGSVAV